MTRTKKTCFVLILVAALFAFCELAFRVAGFYPALPLDRVKPSVQAYFWIADRVLGFRNRANGEYDYDLIAACPTVTMDGHGFRSGYGWTAAGTNPIVLFIGDSVVFGAEVEDGQTITSEVARRLEPDHDVRVLNAGVRGYSTVQSLRMLERCFDMFPSIAVVVYCYCGNDVFENIDGDTYAPAKAPVAVLDRETDRLTIVDVDEPAVPWGEDFLSLMTKQRRAQVRRLSEKRWDRKLRDRIRERSALAHALNQKISTLKEGAVGEVGSGAIADVPVPAGIDTDYARDVLIALLRRLKDTCDAKGVPLLCTVCPATREVRGFDKWSATAGVPYVDVADAFMESPFAYKARGRDRVYDSHYGPHGTKTFAEAFTPHLKRVLEGIKEHASATVLSLPSEGSVD